MQSNKIKKERSAEELVSYAQNSFFLDFKKYWLDEIQEIALLLGEKLDRMKGLPHFYRLLTQVLDEMDQHSEANVFHNFHYIYIAFSVESAKENPVGIHLVSRLIEKYDFTQLYAMFRDFVFHASKMIKNKELMVDLFPLCDAFRDAFLEYETLAYGQHEEAMKLAMTTIHTDLEDMRTKASHVRDLQQFLEKNKSTFNFKFDAV